MARPIAYNTSHPLSGSITSTQGGGTISYTIDGKDRDYTSFASKKWVPSADGAGPIIFVTDSFTQGITNEANSVPLFYVCNGTSSAAIIYTANHLPGSPGNYTTAEEAVTDLLSNDWFILERNQPFEGATANQMLLDLDASKRISYPKTQSTWYDISGNDNGGTLTNGPVFDSGGWFNFDGTNDYCTTSVTRAELRPYGSYEAIFRYDGTDGATYQAIIGGNGSDFFIGKNAGNRDLGIQDGGYNPSVNGGYDVFDGNWHHLMYTFDNGNGSVYLDGILRDNPSFSGADGGRIHYVGFEQDGGGYRWTGDISRVRFYSKVLDSNDVKQNYFGSNIVTDGLVYALDVNNIVSYSKSGTAAYSLTGSGTGTLTNGVGFDQGDGGSFEFDGTNDYISTNFTQTFSDEITVEIWYRGDKTARNHVWDIGAGSTTNLSFDFNDSYDLWVYWNSGGANRVRYNIPGSFTDGNIKHVIYRHSGSNNDVYLNGEKLTITEQGGTQTFTTPVGGTMQLGRVGSAFYFQGNVYAYRVYQNALTPQQILQNYQAEQYRFRKPLGFTDEGLVLYWDAGNQDSYPGTGTTIYDLSGNGNNGTLYNGVAFNTVNGGALQLDGVDDYIDTSGPNLSTTDCTIIGISRYITVNTGAVHGGGRIISAKSNNWLMGHWDRSAQKYYANGWVTDSSGAEGMPDTDWHFYHTFNEYSADQWSFYIDNVLDTGPNNQGANGPNGFSIGHYYSSGNEHSNSNISVLLAYDRILSADEVTEIYDYFKGRYGI